VTAVSSLFVSVVCRLRDERELVEPLLEDLTRVLKAHYENWEIVLVDDGSRDGTTARVKELLGRYEGVRLLRLSRAFGLDIAITAGLESAIGDVVVTLSAETDPPDLIPQLVEVARRENAAVYGVAPARRRGLLREAGARAFYWICRTLLDVPIQRHSTQLRALPR
jgi:polyisoprenyl-phosphate glycosyltransferase